MTLQEQKNCPMISSKATVASRNSLHWSCKPLIRLRKILASRSLKGEGGRPGPGRVGRVGSTIYDLTRATTKHNLPCPHPASLRSATLPLRATGFKSFTEHLQQHSRSR